MRASKRLADSASTPSDGAGFDILHFIMRLIARAQGKRVDATADDAWRFESDRPIHFPRITRDASMPCEEAAATMMGYFSDFSNF